MPMKVKPRQCKNPKCSKVFTPRYSTLEKYCSPKCAYACIKPNDKKTKRPIKRASKKRLAEERVYFAQRKEFLNRPENQNCYIPGCTKRATTIEHIKGRQGYADAAKRQKQITLFLDQDYWRPCCLNHNLQLENDPELSQANQLSKIHQGAKLKKT